MSNDNIATNRDSDLSGREVLMADLRRVADDTGALLNEFKSLTGDEAAAAMKRIEARLGEARAKINRARAAVMRQACDATERTQAYVRENPWTIVAAIAATAAIAALLISSSTREQDKRERN